MNATAKTRKTRKPAAKKTESKKLTLKDLERKQNVNRGIAITAAVIATVGAGLAGYNHFKGDGENSAD